MEKNYIGRKNPKNNNIRVSARFPISYWNLYARILEDKTATNNPVESWHSTLTADTKSHPTLNIVLEELQLEQSKTEVHIISSSIRGKFTRKILKIKNYVSTYHTYVNVISYR